MIYKQTNTYLPQAKYKKRSGINYSRRMKKINNQ